MATVYVKFQSQSDKVNSSDCTTRWPDSVSCNIPISGIYQEKYTNLMVMTGDEEEIANWLAENSIKVVEITEEDGNKIGQTIIPEGTTSTIDEIGEDNKTFRNTYTAGEFTISGGQTWTLTESVDIDA